MARRRTLATWTIIVIIIIIMAMMVPFINRQDKSRTELWHFSDTKTNMREREK